jgi:tetratricopeptide (TPR) repeat protein
MRSRFIAVFLIFSAAVRAQIGDDELASKMRLARVYEETRDYPNASRLYQELYKQKPEFPGVAEGYVRTLFAVKKYDEAANILRAVIPNREQNFDLVLQLAYALGKQNKRDSALAAYQDAEKAGADFHPYSLVVSIAQSMTDVGLAEDALLYLKKKRKEITEGDLLTSEIGALLFKLHRYEEGTQEYLSMLAANDLQLSSIQSRLAVFTQDSLVRKTILQTITQTIDPPRASLSVLRLLMWSYGELKDYRNAFETARMIDDKNSAGNPMTSGFDLYQFAERARAEGDLTTAVMAYDEAVKRMRKRNTNDYNIAQAELGALKTKEQLALSRSPIDSQMLRTTIADYEAYADARRPQDLMLEALIRAADISFHRLFQLDDAERLYKKMIERSGGSSSRTRDGFFALAHIAIARGEFADAKEHFANIEKILIQRNRPEDKEVRMRLLFERAQLDYYSGAFDSAVSKCVQVGSEIESEYANDALALRSLIEENREGGLEPSLTLYARAELAVEGRKYSTALEILSTLHTASPNAPIADDAELLRADLLCKTGKPADAVAVLEALQIQGSTPLADAAGFRAAEITENELGNKQEALKLYQDFLQRYEKSPLVGEARKRARRLRGDSF